MRGLVAALGAALLAACTATPVPLPTASPAPVPFTDAYALTSALSKAAVAKEWVRTSETITEGGAEISRIECVHLVRNISSRDCRYRHDLAGRSREYRMVFTKYIFMELPPDLAAKTGKPWASVDPWFGNTPLDRALAAVADRFPSPAAIDRALPRNSQLESSEEELDGRPVTHYRSAVRYADLMTTAESDVERAQLQQMIDAGLTEMGTEVWVGRDGLIAKLEVDRPLAGGGRRIMTRTFSHWGERAVIAEPAPDLVGPAPEIN